MRRLSLAICIALASVANAATESARSTKIDPEALLWVQRMSHTLSAADAFSAQIQASQAFTTEDGAERSRTLPITLDRHDHYGIRAHAGDRWVYYNRRFLSVVDQSLGVYANALVPGEFDLALTTAYGSYGIAVPLADFLFTDPSQALLGKISAASIEIPTMVGDTAAVQLRFAQPGIEWSLWLARNEQALPLRLELTYTDEVGKPRKSFEFQAWNLQPKLDQADFEFLPEQGMAKINFLTR